VAVLTLVAYAASCGGGEPPLPFAPSGIPAPADAPADPFREIGPAVSAPSAILVGAGDIAMCESLDRAAATASLMRVELNRPGVIGFTLGDNSNDDGLTHEYVNCFGPTWGQLPLRPAPGNHDGYDDPRGHGGSFYYQYFGARAGPPHQGYYSFAAGSWHVVSLNSEIVNRGLQERAQLAWLRSELAAHSRVQCTLAYFHRPMVSSGQFAAGRMVRLWQVLYAAGVDVIVNGHEHFYERFAPQTPAGHPDPAFGIRQFIVGTGGARFHRAGARALNSEVVIEETLGVVRLTLYPGEYDWEFIDVARAVRDSGSGRCHDAPPGH
jgi:alkaline phosphatase